MNNLKEFLQTIKNLNKDQIKEFVDNRINQLEKENQPTTISTITNNQMVGSISKGYINSKTEIISSFIADPFYIDDFDIYQEFIEYIIDKQIENPVQLIHFIKEFIENKFGFKGNQSKRVNIYLHPDKKSIKNFYNQNAALCSERAAVVQNLMSFCAQESYYIYGKLKLKEEECDHAYNILKMRDDTLVLLDITNPVALSYEDKVAYAPAFAPTEEKDINNLKEASLNLNFVSNLYQKQIHQEEKERIYITCNKYLEEDMKL